MEVSLVEAEGLPDGCILSVRAGNTRRQAEATPDKCKLVFPRRPTKNEDGCKVEIFRRMGAAKLDLKKMNALQEITLNPAYYTDSYCEEENFLSMRVVVKLTDPTAATDEEIAAVADEPIAQRPSNDDSMARRHRQALEARSYLDEHRLINWTQVLFRHLVRDKPEDPWGYIAEQSFSAKERQDSKAFGLTRNLTTSPERTLGRGKDRSKSRNLDRSTSRDRDRRRRDQINPEGGSRLTEASLKALDMAEKDRQARFKLSPGAKKEFAAHVAAMDFALQQDVGALPEVDTPQAAGASQEPLAIPHTPISVVPPQAPPSASGARGAPARGASGAAGGRCGSQARKSHRGFVHDRGGP